MLGYFGPWGWTSVNEIQERYVDTSVAMLVNRQILGWSRSIPKYEHCETFLWMTLSLEEWSHEWDLTKTMHLYWTVRCHGANMLFKYCHLLLMLDLITIKSRELVPQSCARDAWLLFNMFPMSHSNSTLHPGKSVSPSSSVLWFIFGGKGRN